MYISVPALSSGYPIISSTSSCSSLFNNSRIACAAFSSITPSIDAWSFELVNSISFATCCGVSFSINRLIINSSSSPKNSPVCSQGRIIVNSSFCSISLKNRNSKAISAGCVFSINLVKLVFALRLKRRRKVSRRIIISLLIIFCLMTPPQKIYLSA